MTHDGGDSGAREESEERMGTRADEVEPLRARRVPCLFKHLWQNPNSRGEWPSRCSDVAVGKGAGVATFIVAMYIASAGPAHDSGTPAARACFF